MFVSVCLLDDLILGFCDSNLTLGTCGSELNEKNFILKRNSIYYYCWSKESKYSQKKTYWRSRKEYKSHKNITTSCYGCLQLFNRVSQRNEVLVVERIKSVKINGSVFFNG